MSADGKAVRISDRFRKIRKIRNFHIKDTPAFQAPGMIMAMTTVIKPVRATRYLHSADLAFLRQTIQVPIDCPTADGWMFFHNLIVDLLCRRVVLQTM